MNSEQITLIDKNDCIVGYEDKITTHKLALLHRAFSIFIFNSESELLLQKRSNIKYHSQNLWTNSCCGHQRQDETIEQSTNRRMFEELGIQCKLIFKTKFLYKAAVGNGLIENELDYIFFGYNNDKIKMNLEEYSEIKYMKIVDIKQNIVLHPNEYTEWFKIILNSLDIFRNI